MLSNYESCLSNSYISINLSFLYYFYYLFFFFFFIIFQFYKCCYMFVICFFFFFQAEDGIRDTSVTGVQTCALPILTANFFHRAGGFEDQLLVRHHQTGNIAVAHALREPGRDAPVGDHVVSRKPSDRKSVV